MLCTKCGKNNAELYYKQTINGHTEEYALCSECADKLKKEGKLSFATPSLFDGFGGFGHGNFFGIDDMFGLPSVKKVGRTATVKKCTLCSRAGKAKAPPEGNRDENQPRCTKLFSSVITQ